MKKYLILALAIVLAMPWAGVAQDKPVVYKNELKNKGVKTILINITSADVEIEGVDDDDLTIDGHYVPKMPKEAEGLRLVSAAGPENTGLGLSVTIKENTLSITTVLTQNSWDKTTAYKIKIPKNLNVTFKQRSPLGNDKPLIIKNINGEIDVETRTNDIELRNISGPVTAKSISGKIKAIFADKISAKYCSFSANHENIDISLPENADIVFGVNTNYSNPNNIFTNLNLREAKAKGAISEQKSVINTPMAKGKVAFSFNTANAKDTLKTSATQIIEEGEYLSNILAKSDIEVNRPTKITYKGNAAIDLDEKTKIMGKDIVIEQAGEEWFPSRRYILNEGKTRIAINTFSGNVFLRKK